VIHHLASRLANVIRKGGEQTKNLIILKIHTEASIIVAMFYALYLGLLTLKQFNKGTFRRVICLHKAEKPSVCLSVRHAVNSPGTADIHISTA